MRASWLTKTGLMLMKVNEWAGIDLKRALAEQRLSIVFQMHIHFAFFRFVYHFKRGIKVRYLN